MAPEELRTERLLLRKPQHDDIRAIFERYSSNPDVCTYLAWPRHEGLEDTEQFLHFSDSEWDRAGVGPYLIEGEDKQLLGSTGLALETPQRASTGYVIAADAWGRGVATEAVNAMRRLAAELGIVRLYAACHPDHRASQRVLEKAEFELEGTLRRYCDFPNLEPNVPQDVLCYSWVPEGEPNV